MKPVLILLCSVALFLVFDADPEQQEQSVCAPTGRVKQVVERVGGRMLQSGRFVSLGHGSTSPTEALMSLREFPEIEILELDDADVSDEDLRFFEPLGNLRAVYLRRTGISNSGIAHLQGLSHLQYLELADTNIDDAGLRHLTSINSLLSLNLAGTKITDEGLVHLSGMQELMYLTLNRTQITDEGVIRLALFTQLEQLYLRGTDITDASVESLLKLSSLTRLDVSGTAFSNDAIHAVQTAIPECEITCDRPSRTPQTTQLRSPIRTASRERVPAGI